VNSSRTPSSSNGTWSSGARLTTTVHISSSSLSCAQPGDGGELRIVREIVGIGDFLQSGDAGPLGTPGVGGVMTTAKPCGPHGETLACVSHGIGTV